LEERVYEPLEFVIEQVYNAYPKFPLKWWYNETKAWLLEGSKHKSLIKTNIKPIKQKKVQHG
jgi:hypothetical protein